MNRIIMFDLYDTVLKDISFNFENGLTYLYATYFETICSYKDFKAYSDTFIPLYDKRKIDYSEVCLIKDEIPLYFEHFDVPKPDAFDALDYEIMQQMQKVTLLDDVKHTLQVLHSMGIQMHILSNSIFTGNSNRRLLNDFGISHYFKRVFSSADYGVRKPSSKFYQAAIGEILAENPGISKEDILYVGNDYITDITGASSMDLSTVWYNVNHAPNCNCIKTVDIDDFKQLIEIAQR